MGSNLNLSGEIECDASIMDGKSLHYGAVGAISGKLLKEMTMSQVSICKCFTDILFF